MLEYLQGMMQYQQRHDNCEERFINDDRVVQKSLIGSWKYIPRQYW